MRIKAKYFEGKEQLDRHMDVGNEESAPRKIQVSLPQALNVFCHCHFRSVLLT
jgi:hypothetical protein